MTHWTDILLKYNVCEKGYVWAQTQPDVQTAWRNCNDGSWMYWLLVKRTDAAADAAASTAAYDAANNDETRARAACIAAVAAAVAAAAAAATAPTVTFTAADILAASKIRELFPTFPTAPFHWKELEVLS